METERSIFLAAAEIGDRAERAEYLDRACAGDGGLRRNVEELLAANERSGSFMRRPSVDDVTANQPATEGLGARVGPYKLLQEIGEGGMGTVFMAEQETPVRRMAAVKIIRSDMDSKGVMARFEAERQALAMMDHPNIAKVYDAGTTAGGRPYFAMELVKGIPITKFCDENRLSVRERLELFVSVCQAIQHAHQKGVIHRDIKPSNVLVAMYDDRPVAKVIDFGVAKATSQKLTDKTLFTAFGAVVGTLEYMSPEQAKLNQLDIDTRSDVYALGVLLYELFTGSTPLDRARLKTAALDEVLRLIREEEPPRPSTRLSTAAALPAIAAARHAPPRELGVMLRGELDWIVMKCLEKDRARRYETANGLAADIQRYLKGDAVDACPPTFAYRLRKTYRRHRAAMLTGVAFAVVLLSACGVSLAFGIQAKRAERLAAAERDRALSAEHALQVKHEDALRSERNAKDQADAASFLFDNLLGQSDDDETAIGNVSFKILLDRAVKELDRDRTRDPLVVARIRSRMGRAYNALGKYGDAQVQLKSARAVLQRELGPDHLETLAAQEQLGLAVRQNLAEAESLLRDALNRRRATQGASHPDAIRTLRYLGGICARQGGEGKKAKLDDSEKLYRDALELALTAHGPDSRTAINCKLALAGHIARKGSFDESRRLTREAVSSARSAFPKDVPFLLYLKLYALRYENQRLQSLEAARALADAQKALHMEFVQYFGADHPYTLAAQDDRVLHMIHANWVFGVLFEGADALSAELLEKVTQVHGRNSTFAGRSLWLRGDVLLAMGKIAEAKALLEEALQGAKIHQDRTGSSLLGIGECLLKEKRYAEAEARLTEGYRATRSFFEGEKLSEYRRVRIERALRNLIEVADNLKKPDDVKKWQKELGELPPK